MMDSEDKKIDIEGVDPRELYGPQNIYLEQMQELHPNLKIIARGSALTVLGPRSDSERFRKRLDGLIAYYLKYGYISKESVQQAFSTGVIEHDAPVDKDVIVYGNNGTIVRARTVNQLKLVQSYDRNDLLLAIGDCQAGYCRNHARRGHKISDVDFDKTMVYQPGCPPTAEEIRSAFEEILRRAKERGPKA